MPAGMQSTDAVQMWFSKCTQQRILARAARFSYTCGEVQVVTIALEPLQHCYTRMRLVWHAELAQNPSLLARDWMCKPN